MSMSEKQRKSRRIEIKKIEDPSKRQVTFSKRRSGLFSKAKELSFLTGAQIAVLVLSGTGRPYSVANPDVDTVIDRFLTPPADEPAERREWWDVPMEGMGLEELQRYGDFLEANVKALLERQSMIPPPDL